jgi:uncharacterized membrane protein
MTTTRHHRQGEPPADGKAQAHELVRQNVRTVAELEVAAQEARSRTDRIIDAIAGFAGSLTFVYVHILWFALWMAFNLCSNRRLHFDPFPFSLLTLVVSLEAIFLSTFILISQNREQQIADRRNHLDLQINMLTEQENTKMLEMLHSIQRRLGIEDKDPVVQALKEATRPEKVAEEIRRHVEGSEAADGSPAAASTATPPPAPS